jgi:CO/xanthine dehydrogenase Mo-binding subunit
MTPKFKVIGQDTLLMDGESKLTGQMRYAPDLKIPGMLHARLVTSPYPHARVTSIDTSAALAVPGVVAVITAKDLPDIQPADRTSLLLAREKVIFTGHPVALVVAETEAAAHDAVDQVMVDYDPLPAVVTIEDAIQENAPLVWENGVSNENNAPASNRRKGKAEVKGDVEKGFAEADVIIERTFHSPVVHQSSLETHSMLIQPDPVRGGATIWSATQDPFGLRQVVAETLDVPESDVRVIATPPGGGFGGKFPIYEPLVALAARLVAQPVRLVLSRSEELLATNPAPALRVQVKVGAKRDGTLTALQGEVIVDDGCFPGWIMGLARELLVKQYEFPNVHVETGCVITNKPSSGSYRAPSAPTMVFVIDTLLDEIAEKLSLDPLDVKRRNLPPLEDSDPAHGALDVFAAIEQHPLWQNREAIRAEGRGVGMAMGAWWVGVVAGAASCSLNRDGKLLVNIGNADVAGSTTGMAMMAAEIFGVDARDVRININDTSSAPVAAMTAGSLTTYNTGSAVIRAAEEARKQVLAIAAQEFEAAVEDIEIVNGQVQVRGVPDKAISLKTIASKQIGKYAPVFGNGRWADTEGAAIYSAQLVETEVDRETGDVRVLRLVIAQDAGKAINPAAVRGQMTGGATQGIGWALYEEMHYDQGGQLLSGSWMDYVMPHANQTATQFETIIVEVPSARGPLGVRGVGEPPVVPTAAAIANSIAHATGVRMTELPMTPVKVLAALNNGK